MKERTLFIIKPDAMAAKSEGKIIDILLRNGFALRRLELRPFNRELAAEFYVEHRGKPFYEPLLEFMTSGEVIVGVVEKADAVADLRHLVGATDPAAASDGTIRRRFGTDRTRNAVHASDSTASAKRETELLFGR